MRPVVSLIKTEEAPALAIWSEKDEKAKAYLYLELHQVKNCKTAHEIWLMSEAIFESKDPVKKASLWRKLITYRMGENGNVDRYLKEFFDIVNKFTEMSIKISCELQSIMLLDAF